MSWPARRSEPEMLELVVSRAGTIHTRRRRRLVQLPAAVAALALVAVLAVTALPVSGPRQELRMADHPEDEGGIVDEQHSIQQGSVGAGADVEGYRGPVGAEVRANAAAGGRQPSTEAQLNGRPTVALTSHPILVDEVEDVRTGDLVRTPAARAPEVDIVTADLRLADQTLVFRIDVADLEAFSGPADGTELSFAFRAQGPHDTGIDAGARISRGLAVTSTWASVQNGNGTGFGLDDVTAEVLGSAVELSIPLAAINATLQHEAFAANRVDGDPSWRAGTRLSNLLAEVQRFKPTLAEPRPSEKRVDEVWGGAEGYWTIGT